MQKDLIIGAYTNYDWSKIKYWANSIDKCGFTGDKMVIVYNSPFEPVQRLSNLGFKITAFAQNQLNEFVYNSQLVIVVQRFYHLWQTVSQLPNLDEYRYVITTDMKDVIFQKNPSEWLEQNLGDKEICASSESLKYKDEPWGADNLSSSYPFIYESMKNNCIWNCGVQAGKIRTMCDLWLQLYMSCHAGVIYNPDQAAYNMLLNMEPWKRITKFTTSEDGWACQAGTTVDPTKISSFRQNLLDPEPLWDGTSVTTSTGNKHAIVHQWDRVPDWHASINFQYGQ